MHPVDEHGHRLFVAVPLPEEAKAFAGRAQGCLPSDVGLRFTSPEQMHCTLAFLGSCDAGRKAEVESIIGGLSEVHGGEAALGGFVFLPTARRTRVVALRIDDAREVFTHVFEALMSALEAAGVMKREERPFRPHVTVARLKRPGFVRPMSDCGSSPFTVESLCLFESELRREGAVHRVLVKKDLQMACGQEMA